MQLIHFTADWCQPCQKMKPTIQDFIINNPNIEYTKVDIESDFDIAKSYNIMGVPTLIAIKNGQTVARHTGIADMAKIKSMFE